MERYFPVKRKKQIGLARIICVYVLSSLYLCTKNECIVEIIKHFLRKLNTKRIFTFLGEYQIYFVECVENISNYTRAQHE